MKLARDCKFCKRHMILEIDDAYAELGDPYKLLQYACCDRCADIREKRRKIEGQIKRACMILAQSTGKLKKEQRDGIREALMELTKRYARMVAEWYNFSGMSWDEEFVNLLMDKPAKFGDILGQYWRHFREVNKANIKT